MTDDFLAADRDEFRQAMTTDPAEKWKARAARLEIPPDWTDKNIADFAKRHNPGLPDRIALQAELLRRELVWRDKQPGTMTSTEFIELAAAALSAAYEVGLEDGLKVARYLVGPLNTKKGRP